MNINAIKQKLNSLQQAPSSGKKEKVDYSKYYWKPKTEGKYQIRFVPSVLNKENPFQEVFIHYGFSKFPTYALTNWGEKDPIVEMANQLREAGGKENWVLAKKLDPKMRVFAPVIVRGEEDKGVRLWEFGKEIYVQLLGIAEDEDYGDFTSITDGRDFTVEIVPNAEGGMSKAKVKIGALRIKPKTSALSDDKNQVKTWLTDQPNILEIQKKLTFEDIKGMLYTFLNPDAEETTEESETETSNVPDDLPWKNDEVPAVSSKYVAKAKSPSKADKFDSVFEEEDEA
jgi:hypothetical protein